MAVNDTIKSAVYLGDGAYVMAGSYQGEVILFTSDGINTTNQVVLGPNEVKALIIWIKESQ